jgi:N6-adenosine-specific RNA methylase IME4
MSAQKFTTLLADPPWQEQGGGGRGAQNHYPLLNARSIARVMIASPVWQPAAHAHLWLWATNSFLLQAMSVIDALGFRYVTNVAWVKAELGDTPARGLGYYFRGSHELLLFAVRGSGGTVRSKRRDLPSVIFGKRTQHSTKPESAYQLIEARSVGPRCELFARTRRPGWASWGNAESLGTEPDGDGT